MRYIACGFFIQLNNAAVSEEPLFRGFFWGFLHDHHWNDIWILVFQAIAFAVGHIYYFGTYNFYLFVFIPIVAAAIGLIEWRSKNIGIGMITHSLVNSVGNVVMQIKL